MSTIGPDERGRGVITITPPIDALATITAHADPITTLEVPEGHTLGVYLVADDEADDALDLDTDEIPDPAFTDDLAETDAHETATVTADGWLTATVGTERRLRVSVHAGEVIGVYLEAADTETDPTQ